MKYPKKSRHWLSAFTLVELLVVIAIIGLLVALLLPAVNSAREASRRIKCINNQRQMALALLNFESGMGALPVAGLTFERDDFYQAGGKQIGWIVILLPYLEEQALFDQFDFELTAYEQELDPQAANLGLKCPSDRPGAANYEHPVWARGKSFSKGNYVAYISPQHVSDAQQLPGALGGFEPGPTEVRGQPLRRVVDGTSCTLAITEVRTLNHPNDQRGAWALSWGGSSLACPDVHHDTDFPTSTYVPDPIDTGRINLHLPNSVNTDELAACSGPQRQLAIREDMPCFPMGPNGLMNGAARSLHPDGVVATALDGHTGFLPNDIDPAVYGRLVSVNDREPTNITDALR